MGKEIEKGMSEGSCGRKMKLFFLVPIEISPLNKLATSENLEFLSFFLFIQVKINAERSPNIFLSYSSTSSPTAPGLSSHTGGQCLTPGPWSAGT